MCKHIVFPTQRRLEVRIRLRNQFAISAETAIYLSLKMYGRFVLPVEAKIMEDGRLVASCTILRLTIQKMLQPRSYLCILIAFLRDSCDCFQPPLFLQAPRPEYPTEI